MNGIILIDKPINITSYDVIRKLRPQFKGFKLGHAGTLDPLASGLLIILVGSATKLSNYLMSDIKSYSGVIKFGKLYDSYDIKGAVLESKTPKITNQNLEESFNHFNGLTYMQMPPIYSALKVNGKRAYELARAGKEVKLNPREVVIYKLLKTSGLINNEVSFLTTVSKQTYIRSLAYDLGLYLNEFSAIKELRRESVGPFNVKDAGTIDKYEIISINEYFKNFTKLTFDEFTTNLVRNGVWLDNRQTNINNEFVVLDEKNDVIALYEPTSDGRYRPKIMF